MSEHIHLNAAARSALVSHVTLARHRPHGVKGHKAAELILRACPQQHGGWCLRIRIIRVPLDGEEFIYTFTLIENSRPSAFTTRQGQGLRGPGQR